MERKITFNELRKIKDSLPDGSIRKIAKEFEVSRRNRQELFWRCKLYEWSSSGNSHGTGTKRWNSFNRQYRHS